MRLQQPKTITEVRNGKGIKRPPTKILGTGLARMAGEKAKKGRKETEKALYYK